MLAINYSTMRNNFKEYCDKVITNRETVIVTRKNEQNVVLMSLDEYNQITKAIRNANYLQKIDASIRQIKDGRGVMHELIEVNDSE